MYLMPPNQLRNIWNVILLQYYLFVFGYFKSYGTIIISDIVGQISQRKERKKKKMFIQIKGI